jgi:hypothetical protein
MPSSEAGLAPSYFLPHKLFNVSEKLFLSQAIALLLSFTNGRRCSLETQPCHLSCITEESITKPGHEPSNSEIYNSAGGKMGNSA